MEKKDYNRLIEKMSNMIPKITLIFLYIQPLLDVLAAILIKNNISNYVTSGIRIIFMMFMFIYILISKYKYKSMTIKYLIILIILLITRFSILLSNTSLDIIILEIKNTVLLYYFIISLLFLLSINEKQKINPKHLLKIYFLYLTFIVVPNILGLGFDSYFHSKVGKCGWFYSANVLGSILVILLPIILTKLKEEKIITKIIYTIMILYSSLTLGTKTPLIGITIIVIMNLIYLIIKNKKQRKIILSSLIIFITAVIIIFPSTPIYKNIKIHLNFVKKENNNINLYKILDEFVFSKRLTLEKQTAKEYKKSKTYEKLLGIGYINKNNKEELKTIEIDYFDIFYREGVIGFIIFFTPVIYLLIKNIKNTKLINEDINIKISIFLILFLALFQGHIFYTPGISIYVALILTMNLNTKREVVNNEFKCKRS